MKKRVLSVLLAAAMLSTLLAGCERTPESTSDSSSAAGGDVVKIGVFEPASGDNGAGGKQETLGIQYANYVTPTVEIGGKEYTVQLDIVDNESSNDKAPSAAATLVSDGVSVVLGSYGSGVSIAGSDTFKEAGILEGILEDTVSAWERNYPPTDRYTGVGRRFQEVLRTAHERTGRRCVVLIDEYDKPLLDVLETGLTTVIDGQERLLEDWHKDVLRGFYSVFKAADADLQFVLLTGVTKFAQVSVFSGFNQPKDISMDSRYDTLCGITQQELESCFAEPIKDLAAKYGVSVPEITDSLKRRYDGYHFSEEMTDVYNPFSLLNVFDSLKMRDYWMTTGTSDYLVRLLSRSDENMEEMLRGEYTPSAFADYKATVEMPLPMIYQSGYLTIKGYDRETELFRLDFPNEEVRRGFLSMLASGYISKSDARMESWAANVRNALNKGNIEDWQTA